MVKKEHAKVILDDFQNNESADLNFCGHLTIHVCSCLYISLDESSKWVWLIWNLDEGFFLLECQNTTQLYCKEQAYQIANIYSG